MLSHTGKMRAEVAESGFSPDALLSPVHVLLVEDNAADAELTRLALDATAIPYLLAQLGGGHEVLPYLRHLNRCAAEAAPDLILLDLGLPGEDGFEILAEIAKMRGAIHDIPLAVLTGYENFAYLRKTYEPCISDYLAKPLCPMRLERLATHKRF